MSIQILCIMGSPRKGDSYKVCKIVEEKMKSIGNVNFEYLFLKDCDISYCRGCCACMAKGEDYCPLKDDTRLIKSKIQKADGVIFCSPVYVHHVTALMKNFIDRFAYIFHRPCFFDKSALVISTTGGSGLDEVLKYLEMTGRGWGFYVAGKIGVISPLFQRHPEYRDKIINTIEKSSKRFFEATENKRRPSPDLYGLMFFNAMKLKIKRVEKYYPRDFQYWKERGWLNKDYFLDIDINIFKKAYCYIASKQMELKMKKYSE